MKWLVWCALAAAGVGYWWYEDRKRERHAEEKLWTEQDGADTAERIARLYETPR